MGVQVLYGFVHDIISGLRDDLFGNFSVSCTGVRSGVSVGLWASLPSAEVVTVVVEEALLRVCGEFIYSALLYVPESVFHFLADTLSFFEAR